MNKKIKEFVKKNELEFIKALTFDQLKRVTRRHYMPEALHLKK